jgi:hypothetical protein
MSHSQRAMCILKDNCLIPSDLRLGAQLHARAPPLPAAFSRLFQSRKTKPPGSIAPGGKISSLKKGGSSPRPRSQ